MNNNQVKKDNDTRKIFTTLVLVLTLMIFTTGATYAYFALSAESVNSMTGTAATASLDFQLAGSNVPGSGVPSYIAPTVTANQSKPMVPQKALVGTTNVLQKAFNGAGSDKCVDGNGNIICKAYTFTIKNTSSATAVIKGQIKFTYGENSIFTNLKWKLMDSATNVTVASGNTGTTATTSFANFETNISLATNTTKTYHIIFWIEETDTNQNDTDKGTWYATVQFINNIDGTGVTSTITS